MKRISKVIVLLIVMFLLSSCGKKSYVVFDYNCNGRQYHKCELKNSKLSCYVETPTCGEYKFKGWYKANEYENQVDLRGTFNEDEIIYARWEKVVEGSSGSQIEEPSSIVLEPSSQIEKPSSQVIDEPSSQKPTPTPEATYTISFNANGGTGGQSQSISGIKYGADLPTINQTKPTRSGYIFMGWYDSQTGGTQYYNSSNSPVRKYDKKSNITLYAQWNAETYTISFNTNGGSGGQSQSISGIKYGDNMPTISSTKPTKSGYTFTGWYDSQTGGTQYYNSSNVSVRKYDKKGNTTLYAQWRVNVLSIQYNGNGGTWNSKSSTYGVNSSNTVIVKSTGKVYVQQLNYGTNLEASGLVDYNGSWFSWKKDKYTVESKKEYIVQSTALNQNKVYKAIDLAKYSGCDLSKSDCTITVKVNWIKAGYGSVNYDNFEWTYYDSKQGPLNSYYSESYPYAIWAPKNKSDLNGVSLPLIIWLHGAGEMREWNCASDCFLSNGLPPIVSNWKSTGLSQIPAIIFAPQLDVKETDWWAERAKTTVRKGIDYLADAYNIDKKKVSLMGHSSGGSGVVYISSKNQDLFSALVIMSGFAGFNEYKDYYKKIALRGYMTSNPERAPYGDGNCGMENAFKQIGRSNDLVIFPKTVSHVDVPKKSLTQDENNDGVSDLMYWLYGEDAKIKK